ncbi:MAG: hypothetical protein V1925_01560 [Candidatus Omnitrophota bacterium]
MLRLNRHAQSTAEYVIVIGLIVAAVVAMQTYVKRGLQGRIQEAVDYVENTNESGVVTFSGGQYEPYYLSSSFDNDRNSTETEDMLEGGAIDRALTIDHSERTGSQTIGAAE